VSPAQASVTTDRLDACLSDVEAWLKASRLRLNPSEAPVMWLGSAQQLAKKHFDEEELSSQVSTRGSSLSYGGYHQLRQLRSLKRCMTDDAIKHW
jgi:hypothetical protein